MTWMRLLVVALAATGTLLSGVSGVGERAGVEELKRLVPPPPSHQLGGEPADDATYRRFLSVSDWDPAKAAPKLERDFAWRRAVRPRSVRPAHCPTLCRQGAWRVLMQPRTGAALLTWGGGQAGKGGGDSSSEKDAGADGGDGAEPSRGRRKKQPPLHPPHSCPPMQTWRYTRHGLPITLFECWRWRPDLASKAERIRHVAYHMEHCIRRTSSPKVQRLCVVMDLRGFQSWMLPHVKAAVDILRNHYPGRTGAVCFINVPGYFRPIWKVISPWLDEEILSKTFFAPGKVDDVEKAIAWVDKKNLKVGPV